MKAGEPRRRTARPRPDVPGIDPAIASSMDMLLALLSQMTVMRERLDTVERLIEKHGLFKQSDVEEFKPDPAAETARNALRLKQIEKAMRPLLSATQRANFQSTEEDKPS